MKLNPDCIRDILLAVEKECSYNHAYEYEKDSVNSEFLTNYTHDEIVYHIRQCSKSGLIDSLNSYDGGDNILIGDLSPEGHEFLANIRQDNNWNKTKEIATKAGSFGLDILKTISEGVATAYVKQQLNLL